MSRTALHSDDIKIEQKAPIIGGDLSDRDGEIVSAEQVMKKNYFDELAFNEEPVTIRLEPSPEKNAATRIPVWVNGKGCEVFLNGRWVEMAYIPVGVVVTVKRKYLEVIVRAKFDRIDTTRTEVRDLDGDQPNNVVARFTSSVSAFSVIEDRNPRGSAWLTEMYRRNF